ncbi:MAG: DUF937 domain-containing protein [Acidimicrobiales bacterium]
MAMYHDISRLLSEGSAIDSLSGFLGESRADTSRSIAVSVPAIVAGLNHGTVTGGGAAGLFGLLDRNDGSILDDVGSFLSTSDGGAGSSLVGGIFGEKQSRVTEAIADRSGIAVGTITRLLPAIAPLVMGFLARSQTVEGFDEAGLVSRLAADRESMSGDGLGGLLAAIEDEMATGPASSPPPQDLVGDPVEPEPTLEFPPDQTALKTSRPWWFWFFPLLAVVALLGLILSQCGGDNTNITNTTVPVVDNGPTTTTEPEEPKQATIVPDKDDADRFESGQLLDSADEAGDFDEFLSALEAADIADQLEGEGPFTVFAPTDDAFAELSPTILADEDLLEQVLKYHIVEGELELDDLTEGALDTLADESLAVAIDGDTTINGTELVDSEAADNGLIYSIDSVLIPPSVLAATEASVNSLLDLDAIGFEPGSADLTGDSSTDLDKAVAFLTANPVDIAIEGHTDSDGEERSNLLLSQQRAEAVLDYLVDHGIEISRLSAQGFGEGVPIADNDTAEGRGENRRIEFRIID